MRSTTVARVFRDKMSFYLWLVLSSKCDSTPLLLPQGDPDTSTDAANEKNDQSIY